ncbi:MAG: hypothetical protein R3330_00215, partial [Saprospiraceae bacterium]|nr:hypothetical protein [Saprospiraceae bacterium]
MTRNFLSILAALLLSVGMMQAQQTDAVIIEDDMTVDAEQHAQWKTGQEKYPAKPRSMWELGVNVGHAFISGDVEASGLSGFGVGLTFRKAINYVLSIRFGGQYTLSKGYDARSTRFSTFQNERTYQQATNQSALAAYDGGVIHRNYKTGIFSVSVETVLNVGNILF